MTRTHTYQIFIRTRGLVLAALLLVVAATMPVAANATFLGASWPYTSGTWLHVKYGNCVGISAWSGPVDDAASAWTATSTPIYLDKDECASGNPVSVWAGALYSAACATSSAYTFGGVMLKTEIMENADIDTAGNYTGFGTLGVYGQRACLGHEFGHALGFDHAGQYGIDGGVYSGPISPSIMDYCCAYAEPQVYDVCQANLLYPGKYGCFS